jgi:group I intron endonuclease
MYSGIYNIENKLTCKVYIGQSINIEKRLQDHIRDLNRKKHFNKHLQKAWNKYGSKHFRFQVIENIENPTKLKLDSREQYWINHYDSANPNKGYNANPTAGHSSLGIKRSNETKQKLRKALTGKKHTKETRQKMSKSKMGHIPWNKGLVDAQVSPFKGRFHTEAWKKRMSKIKKGTKHSPETRVKMSKSQKGKKRSLETRNNVKKSWILRKFKNQGDKPL